LEAPGNLPKDCDAIDTLPDFISITPKGGGEPAMSLTVSEHARLQGFFELTSPSYFQSCTLQILHGHELSKSYQIRIPVVTIWIDKSLGSIL